MPIRRRLQQCTDGGQDDPQGNEGNIHNGQVQRLSELLRRDIADVRPLHAHHARVLPDAPGKLAIADIDGEDLLRALLQQAVRKAARRGARVAADEAGRIDAEVAQRLFELQAAAADVGAGIAPQFYNGLVLDRRTGLVRFLPVDIDLAGHDERLRLASAVAQAALHENDIQSFLMLHSDIPPRQRQQEILRPTPPGGTAPAPRRGE